MDKQREETQNIQILRKLEGEFTAPYEERIANLERELASSKAQFQQLRAKIPDEVIALLNQQIPEEKVYRIKGRELNDKINQLASWYYKRLAAKATAKQPSTQLIQDLMEYLVDGRLVNCRLNSMIINNEIKVRDT